MAGFLGYALAGAAQGLGQGMVEEARARREAAMEELRERRLMAREDRQFDRQNQLLDRQQSFSAQQSAADRDFRERTGGTLVRGPNGEAFNVFGDSARPVIGPDGEQMTGLQRSEAVDAPSSNQRRLIEGRMDQIMENRQNISAAINFGRRQGLGNEQLTSWAYDWLEEEADLRNVADKDAYVNAEMERLGLIEPQKGRERPAPQTRTEPPPAQSSAAPGRPQNAAGARAGQVGAAAAQSAEASQEPRLSRGGMTDEQIIAAAKRAVPTKGEEAVRARLRQLGIDPDKAGI